MSLYRQNGDRERQRWEQVRGWRIQGCVHNTVGEEVVELRYGQALFVVDDIRSVCYGTQQKVERIHYAVIRRHSRLGEISMEEFDCVGEKNMLGDNIDHVEALVVLERRENDEALAVVEVP